MAESEYRKLSNSEIASNLKKSKSWRLAQGKLRREIDFKTFEDAIAFMVRASLEVTKLDHHPEWFNMYNRVRIELTTHDVGGISDYDFLLADKIDEIVDGVQLG